MTEKSSEQKLVDICFEIAIAMKMNSKNFEKMSRDEVGEWVAKQLKDCGYSTKPCGSSWGVLVDENGKFKR